MTPSSNHHIRKSFGPLAGTFPNNTNKGVYAYGTYNYFGCADVTYCDAVMFRVNYPQSYIRSFRGSKYVSFGIRITLTWPTHASDPVDLFIWSDPTQSSGSPLGVCANPGDPACRKHYPEVFDLVEPSHVVDDTSTKHDESKDEIPIYLSIVNETGANTGYTLDLQWFLVPLGSLPDFKPPPLGGASFQNPPVTKSKTAPPFKGFGNGTTDPLPKIVIPGADGKLASQDLNYLAAGNRLKPLHSGVASWVWWSSAIIAALAIGMFGFLVYRRRQNEAVFR